MTQSGLITAFLVYLAAAFLVLLIVDFLLRRWWRSGRSFVLLLALAVLCAPGASDDSFTLFSPAYAGILFNILAHSWVGVVRALFPVCLTFAVVSFIASWISRYWMKEHHD